MTDRRRPLEEACPSPFCTGAIRRTWWTDVVGGEPTPPGQVAVCCATCSRVLRLEPAPTDWPARPAEVQPDAEVAAQLCRGLEYDRTELPRIVAGIVRAAGDSLRRDPVPREALDYHDRGPDRLECGVCQTPALFGREAVTFPMSTPEPGVWLGPVRGEGWALRPWGRRADGELDPGALRCPGCWRTSRATVLAARPPAEASDGPLRMP